MKQMQKSTFSLLYIIKKSKLRKNGEAPICLRITVNGRIEEVMVKRTVPVASWNQAKECSNGKDHAARELNHYLSTVKARIYQMQRELEIDGVPVTALSIKNRYYGKEANGKTLCEVYREHNEKCRALVGIDFSLSTVEKFDTSLSHVREYISHQYGKDDISLSEMNGQFIRDFEFYLKTVRHCQHNSAIKHLKNLKKVVRIALANEWMKKDPFLGIQFRHKEKNIEFMTQEELERIIHKKLPVQRLEQVRDIFVFCCMSGLAFIDVQQLTPGHLVKDNNGALWIRKNPHKTGNISRSYAGRLPGIVGDPGTCPLLCIADKGITSNPSENITASRQAFAIIAITFPFSNALGVLGEGILKGKNNCGEGWDIRSLGGTAGRMYIRWYVGPLVLMEVPTSIC